MPAARVLGGGEMQAGQPKQPVGVDGFIQLPGGGLGIGCAVDAAAVQSRCETAECGGHLLFGHLAAEQGIEQRVLVAGVPHK